MWVLVQLIQFEVNGAQVEIADDGDSLLDVLRDALGLTSVKDGCSPQGQCGCCTVLVDGEPRVSCVTPARRVAGRSVTTLEGLPEDDRDAWATAFCATGGSQCGFCTPGIVMRLDGLRRKGGDLGDRDVVNRALAAHLCRCTGWQTIVEAAAAHGAPQGPSRDYDAAAERAHLEGHGRQTVGPDVALGHGGFADDLAPPDSPIAVRGADGSWVTGSTLSAARRAVGKVQGRRTTVDPRPPIDLPEGDWAVTLQTGWVEPAYLETDASWATPGGIGADPLANGGAFGGKHSSPLPAEAQAVATEIGTPVRLRWSREDVVQLGPKRPPMAIGLRDDGSGVVRVATTTGIAADIASVAPDLVVESIDVPGPPTSATARAAGWGEILAIRAALAAGPDGTVTVDSPDGGSASVRLDDAGAHVTVRCGDVLDAVVLRSYCIGAVHMALGWVTSEGLTVDAAGEVLSLTIRSFGIVRPGEMIPVYVEIDEEPGVEAKNGSDAVFVAAAAAIWNAQGRPPVWPTGQPLGSGA